MWRTPPMPIFIERVSDRLRHHYRRQERFDVGEDRPRRDERRAATRLRPHSEQLGEVHITSNFGRKLRPVNSGRADETAARPTQGSDPMSESNLATTPADILGSVQALEEAVDTLHWLAVGENPYAMREAAQECLGRITELVTGKVLRMPSTSMARVGIPEQDRRVGRIHRLDEELQQWQAEDTAARHR